MKHDDCQRYQEELFYAVDSGEQIGSALADHLARCEACRLYHRRIEQLGEALADQAGELKPLPAGFAAKVMSAIEASPARRRRPIVLRLVRPAIAAAALCLLVGAAWMIFHSSRTANRRTVVNRAGSDMPISATVDLTDQLLGSAAELARNPLEEEMTQFVNDTRRLGDSISANLPMDLIPGVDRGLVESALPLGQVPAVRGPASRPFKRAKG